MRPGAGENQVAYNTGNPIGSTSPKDLSDNARNLDLLLLGDDPSYPDRKGVPRKSWKGMEAEYVADRLRRATEFHTAQTEREAQFKAFLDASGYEAPVPYAPGLTLERATQTVTYLGNEYRVKSQFLPLLTTNWADDESKLKLVGDDSLRQDMANFTDPAKGAAILGRGVVTIASIADLLTATHKESLTYRVASYHGGWAVAVPYVGPLGGGDFKFLAGSTIPADGGIVFEVPGGRVVRMGHTSTVKPEWYGALGDGVQDDTDTLRLACRSEGQYVADYGYTFRKEGGRRIKGRPGGNYRITRPVYLRKGDWLQGGGYTATRIFSNQSGIGQLIYVGWGLVDGVLVRDPGGLIPKVTDLCLAETVGGVSAIFLDSISGWDVRDCWFFADVGVRTKGITNDGFMLNCVADNGSGHLAIFEGTGDGYHTGQSTTVDNCGAFKTRYGGIKLDGVSDVIIKGGHFNFIPFYGLYTGTVKKNSRIKAIGVNFKGTIDGVGMDVTQQHIRVTAPTAGFAIIDCGLAYSQNADIQANYPVQVRGGRSEKAAIDSIVCLGGRSTIKGTEFADTGRYPVRSTVRIVVEGLEMENPLSIGVPADIFARGAIYLSGSGSKSTVNNCHRYDDKGPAVSTNGLNGIRSSGNTSEGDVDVLHYTGNGVNYSVNERADNPVGLWRNVELLRGGHTRWIDSSGRLRIKNGDPTSETDGTVVGAQA